MIIFIIYSLLQVYKCIYNMMFIEDIYLNDFFQFVCIFTFFNTKQIITYALSLLQIYSNIFITIVYIYKQIIV